MNNEYEAQRSEMGKVRIDLLKKYADLYDTMTDEDAADLLQQNAKFQSTMLKIKQRYTKRITKSLGAKKAMQWLQLENYLDRQIGLYIMDNVPFIGELE